MNEREDDKELIRRMAEVLRNHTEPYREGAWEQFSARTGGRPSRRIVLWPAWSAAAVLLIAFGWLVLRERSGNSPAERSADAPALAQETVIGPSANTAVAEGGLSDVSADGSVAAPAPEAQPVAGRTDRGSQRERIARISRSRSLGQDRITPAAASVGVDGDRTPSTDGQVEILPEAVSPELAQAVVVDTASVAEASVPVSGDGRLVAAAPKPVGVDDRQPDERLIPASGGQGDPAMGDALFQDRFAQPQVASAGRSPGGEGAGRWNVGIVVSPSLTSQRVNMGGGIELGYRLTDRLSVSSGVSIGELGLAQNSRGPKADAYGRFRDELAVPSGPDEGLDFSSESYKEVTDVTSTVVALDVPLNIQYNLTQRFYTSVGVSFVRVLNEQRTAHFVDRLNERTFDTEQGGDRNAAVQAVMSTEKTGYHPLQGRGYAGFVNFSVGRRVNLSRKLSVSFEPFFKLPVGRLSREEMDFTNGGVRVVTGF